MYAFVLGISHTQEIIFVLKTEQGSVEEPIFHDLLDGFVSVGHYLCRENFITQKNPRAAKCKELCMSAMAYNLSNLRLRT